MSNLVKWAEEELNRLVPEGDGKEIQEMVNKDVLEVVKVFSEQGHSGFSASYALGLIKRLLDWKPVTSLTGEESEWNDVGDNTQQNNRCSAVFRKNNDNSTAYYIDGKVFSDDRGQTWWTNGDSFVPVTFPFTVPEKPEYVILPTQEETVTE
ncbi:hypothetical protein P4G96_24170 [Bacillus cereus]|nr:hypothetical protein [Bacillus cereus]MEB8668875.1 hypothetical protein [Bacillus cereus]